MALLEDKAADISVAAARQQLRELAVAEVGVEFQQSFALWGRKNKFLN